MIPRDFFKRISETKVKGRVYKRQIVGRDFLNSLSPKEIASMFQNKDRCFTEDYVGSIIKGNICYDVFDLPQNEINVVINPESETEEEEYYSEEWYQLYDEDDYLEE